MEENTGLAFQPVILGTDIGTYALARSFHEEWKIKPTIVTTQILGPIMSSGIIDTRLVNPAKLANPQSQMPLIDGLIALGPERKKDHPGKALLLIANIDSNVRDVMRREKEIKEHYVVAFPSLKVIEETSDKVKFPLLAKEHGLNVPPTVEIDFSTSLEGEIAKIEQIKDPFPWIIKPATSAGYERLKWRGKAKVYSVADKTEAKKLLENLYEHTHENPQARRFVLQPRVEGNDSFNLSVTAYVDKQSRVTMLGSAQVLLEDHSPTALGNPVAMITEPYPRLYEQVSSFLQGVGWHGFANFDFKVDSRSGIPYCFEVNPRIGRNSYYNTSAGMNPMKFFVEDVIAGKSVTPQRLNKRVYYSILPKHLVLRYVDKEMGKKIKFLYRQKKNHDPLYYPAEWGLSLRGLKRLAYVVIARENHWRKYHRNYPVAKFREGETRSLDTAELTRL